MENNRYGNYYRQASGLWRSLRDGDFEESDVWDVLDNRRGDYSNSSISNEPSTDYLFSRKPTPSTPRMISSRPDGNSVSTTEAGPKMVRQSAPVNIPFWPKLQRQKLKKKPSASSSRCTNEEADDRGLNESDDDNKGESDEDDEDEDDDDDDAEFGNRQMMPPHEFISMRLARSHISSFSVFEGVGRTLKGRDLSKVRNAVLTRTGFLEYSP